MSKELLIGCGNRHDKRVRVPGASEEWGELVTLDIDPNTKPDVIFDLDSIWRNHTPLPFEDDTFDELHAYEVLEHIGHQGNAQSFFWPFQEFWRVLKPGGYLCATVPHIDSPWVWGDPGHRRLISTNTLVFLSQAEYTKQVGTSAMTDYRWCYDADFDHIGTQVLGETLLFALKAVKPSRKEVL